MSKPNTRSRKLYRKGEENNQTFQRSPHVDEETNPLKWWSVHASSYPMLAVLAKKYLCISASSSASERVFSTSGNIVSKKRSCLKSHNRISVVGTQSIPFMHYKFTCTSL